MAKRKGKSEEVAAEAAAEEAAGGDVPAAEADEDAGTAVDSHQAEFLGFMLADEEYALDILEIKEIIRLQDITVVPRTPGYLKGIITLRGVIIPVFDLRCRLGLDEAEHDSRTRIVVVYRGEEFAGLIVDSITQVMRVDLDAIEPPPPTIGIVEAEYIKGVTHIGERLIILLNLARVLDVNS
jgi:purine-binding chemotaxis protein CheW